MDSILKVSVIGAGIMGHGIAQVCAQGGKTVILIDVSEEVLEQAKQKVGASLKLLVDNQFINNDDVALIMNRISYSTDLKSGVGEAGIVIEAIPEKLPLKASLYEKLDVHCDSDTIIASNTSGIPISKLASLTKRPRSFIGTHFYMPAHLIPLVEVIQTDQTDPAVINTVMNFMSEIGKKAVHVRKDIPGFIGNRLQHALAREAMSLVQNGVASPEDIDIVVKTSLAIRLVFTGPLEQRDFNGLDTHLSIAEYLYKDLESSKEPLQILREKVSEGKLGLKTGEGFYNWKDKSASEVIASKNQQLLDLLNFLKA